MTAPLAMTSFIYKPTMSLVSPFVMEQLIAYVNPYKDYKI